jgi:hypothetical protein
MLKESSLAIVLVVGALACMTDVTQGAPAQTASNTAPDLDDLERRLEAAKAAAAKKEQADKVAAEQRKAEQARAAEAAAKQQATLVVKTDADCQLTVNGEDKGNLTAGQTQSIKINPGDQMIECVTTNGSGAKAEATKAVEAGTQALVELALADEIARKQLEAQQRAVAESAARDPGNLGFVDLGGGILKDTKTGLEWTQNDNGSGINWRNARKYCSSRGGSWRLPSTAELQAIFDANVPSPKVCWKDNRTSATCKVSRLLNLTGPWFWSGEANGSAEAFDVSLNFGGLGSDLVGGKAVLNRALCVRHP